MTKVAENNEGYIEMTANVYYAIMTDCSSAYPHLLKIAKSNYNIKIKKKYFTLTIH